MNDETRIAFRRLARQRFEAQRSVASPDTPETRMAWDVGAMVQALQTIARDGDPRSQRIADETLASLISETSLFVMEV